MAKTTTKTTRATTAKKPAEAKSHYTDDALRERLKQQVMAGTKGGRAGQWSARKAQLLAHEYEAAGGGYTGAKSDAQKHLDKWGDEHWQTRDGAPAKRGKTMARYLPKKAWAELTPAERKATDAKKQNASRTGKQFVANTKVAKKVGAKARTAKAKPVLAKKRATKKKTA